MLNSFSSSLLIASIALVVGMTLMVLASPADVAAQSEPTPRAYLTVVVTDGDDTVSWSDPGNCSSDYNIYLAESPRHNTPETPPTHLGAAASRSTEATLAIPGSGQALNVKLYCGAYDAESSENGLIASTQVSRSGRMRHGTYSSSAMTALSISSGTLSPVFDRGIFQYTVEVQSDVEAITLNPTVLTGYETNFLKNPGWGVISTCDWFGNHCTYTYSSDGVLSDADTDAEGFEVNLNRGENRIGIGVNKGSIGIFAETIRLTVTVQNATATGQPTISGTAQVGQLLTADTAGISDVDGLDNVSYSYQWLTSRDVEIDGATSSNYLLQESDDDKAIKVRVTFTDDADHQESLTSSPTLTVIGEADISSDATLSALMLSGVHIGKFDPATTSYTARVNNTVTETTVTSTLNHSGASHVVRLGGVTDADGVISLSEGSNLITVEVTAEDGQATRTYTVTVTRLDSEADPMSSDATLSGLTLSGIDFGTFASGTTSYSATVAYNVSQTTVSPTVNHSEASYAIKLRGITDSDGALTLREGSNVISVEVRAEDKSTTQTYTVTVTRRAASYTDATLRSLSINHVDYRRSELLNAYRLWVDVGYTAKEATVAATVNHPGASYVLKVGGVEDDDGVFPLVVGFNYFYIEVTAEDGETREAYDGYVIREALRVSGITSSNYAENDTTPVATYSVGDAEGLTITWSLSGNDRGDFSISSAGVLSFSTPPAYESPADSDTDNVYRVTIEASDGTTTAKRDVIVTVTNETEVAARPNSAATGAPTITGTAQVGQTLTASPTGISDADGLSNVSYIYQWTADDGTGDSDITDATDSTYTLVDEDAGKTIKVEVSFTDDAENAESLTSAATAAVAATVPGVLGGLTVSVNDTGKLDLSWEAPDKDGGSAIAGYKVQWKEAADSWDTPADVSETTVAGTAHTVSGLTDGVEYTFRVVAVNEVGDSTASSEESGTPRETTAPTVSSTTVDGVTLTLTFSEGLTETPLPAATTFTVNVGSNQRGVNSVAISGSTVTLTLASAATSTDAVTVSYTVPSDAAAARLKDLSDNSVASFAAQAVTNNTAAARTPLTASIHSEPASHDGQAEFTFELRFSENLEGFSYRTLRDHAFTVTGGEVQEARRLVRGSNTRWETRINPTSNADVTIVLPITTVCTANGAICTEDGRKLSNRLELTVSGPTSQQSSQQQENTLATGSPTISGTVQVGETLTALTSGISDSDGTTNASYTYQWIANEGTSDSDIADATASIYALVDGDAGKTIKVQVTFTDDAGNEETLTSAATAAVEARPNTPATGSPTISGTVQVRETLTASTSGIADTDGLTNVSYSYQWIRNDGSTDTDIQDATGSGYTLVDADEGKTIKVQVTFTDDAGHEETLTSTATASVEARPNSPATGAPTISGTVQFGETLTASTSGIADTDGLTNVSYSYQWIRNDGSTDTDIQDATGSGYTLVDADEGKTIKVKVSFTDDAGHEETLTSTATAAVGAAPEPLTVSLENNPASHNGTDEFTFQIQFSEQFELSYKTLRDHAFAVDGGTVKKAQRQVRGSNIGWTITVEPASNAEVEIVLPATTDCGVTGAICTADGRKLSNSLDFTVVGPGE